MIRPSLACVLAACVVIGLAVAPALGQPWDGLLADLQTATEQASMSDSLRRALLDILALTRQRIEEEDRDAAASQLSAYVALLGAHQGVEGAADSAGTPIAPDAASPLIAAADSALRVLSPSEAAYEYQTLPILPTAPSAATVDWRDQGVVTGVKTEGECRSSYAFSATGAAEAAWAINRGLLLSLSEQQLIDCDDANNGCEDGSPLNSLAFGLTHGGFATTQSYPYRARQGICKTAQPAVTISGLARPAPAREDALQSVVANFGPVAAILRVPGMAWLHYRGGVFNHGAGDFYVGVLIVGYGMQHGIPCWIVKASLGTDWGDKGYAWIPRGRNALGITNYVVIPLVQ